MCTITVLAAGGDLEAYFLPQLQFECYSLKSSKSVVCKVVLSVKIVQNIARFLP